MEWGLNALMDLFSTETSKMSHEKKEAVLETIVQVSINIWHVAYHGVPIVIDYCRLICMKSSFFV